MKEKGINALSWHTTLRSQGWPWHTRITWKEERQLHQQHEMLVVRLFIACRRAKSHHPKTGGAARTPSSWEGQGRLTWSVLWLSHTPGSDHAFLSWEIIPHSQWKNYRTFPPLCSPPFYPRAFKLWMVLKSQFTVQFGVHVLPRSIVDSSTLTHPHQQSGEKVLGSECRWHFQHFQHIPCPHRPAQNVVSRGQSHQRAQIPFNCRHPSLYPNQRWPQEG